MIEPGRRLSRAGRRFLAVFHARNLEFVRDRSTLIWNIVFPVVLIIGFAVVFGNSANTVFRVGLVSDLDAYTSPPAITTLEQVGVVRYQELEPAVQRLRRHELHLVLDVDQREYWVNETSAEGRVLEELLSFRDPDYRRQLIEGRDIRYVDWALPGILSMNIMFACMFGVGYVLVRYRRNGVLKRLYATPLRTTEFLLAQVASRLLLVFAVTGLLLAGARLLLDIVFVGTLWRLAVVTGLGGLCLVSLGLLIAARSQSEELTSGLINLATWPMIFLSSAWFTIEGAPQWVQLLARAFPLTHLVTAMRSVMLDGATLTTISDSLLALVGMTVLFMGAGILLFDWRSSQR